MIFTILVSFLRDNAMHCLPQRLKSTLFEIFSNGATPKGTSGVRKKFQITLILAFEVIVQQPKDIFEISLFSI